MVIDTSAFVAIFLAEPERQSYRNAIIAADTRLVSAVSIFETGIVLEARIGEGAAREFDLFAIRSKIEVVAVDFDQAELARSAWRRYGKGRHPAALNFGDCFAYALAKSSGEPILAKGTDFVRTDIEMCSVD
jgi:ribonuclease VapC